MKPVRVEHARVVGNAEGGEEVLRLARPGELGDGDVMPPPWRAAAGAAGRRPLRRGATSPRATRAANVSNHASAATSIGWKACSVTGSIPAAASWPLGQWPDLRDEDRVAVGEGAKREGQRVVVGVAARAGPVDGPAADEPGAVAPDVVHEELARMAEVLVDEAAPSSRPPRARRARGHAGDASERRLARALAMARAPATPRAVRP